MKNITQNDVSAGCSIFMIDSVIINTKVFEKIYFSNETNWFRVIWTLTLNNMI